MYMGVTSDLSADGVLGFFELDDSGTVRFSSTVANSASESSNSIIGQNFFESIGFRNRDELRRHFRRFIESREAADSFAFDCCLGASIIHTKVTFTRAFQTEFFPPESIVMLSIKESSK
jgi:hypothetical protein